MWSKGYSAEEKKAAFARAQELAGGIDNADERFTTKVCSPNWKPRWKARTVP